MTDKSEWRTLEDAKGFESDLLAFGRAFKKQGDDGKYEHLPLNKVTIEPDQPQ